jgi:HEAT repeat protein
VKFGVQNPPPPTEVTVLAALRNIDVLYISSGLDNIAEEKNIRRWRWDGCTEFCVNDRIAEIGGCRNMGLFYLVKLNMANVEEMREKRDVKGLITALESTKDPRVRIQAARALGAIRDKSAGASLVQALKDEDCEVRYEAAEALGKIKSAHAAEHLVRALKDEERDVRTSVVEALTSIGKPAEEHLVQALNDNDSDIRMGAAEALDKLGWQPGDDTERVQYLLAKRDWGELTTVGETAAEPLIRALDDNDWAVRTSAAEALGTIGDARAVEPLIRALHDEYWNVNRAAEKTLGTIGEPAIEPLIQALLRDNDRKVRASAAGALGRIKNKRAFAPLAQALNDEDVEVRASAADALGKLGWQPGDDTERVRYLLAKRDWKGLAKLGEPAVEPLIHALRDNASEVRKRAAEALGTIGDKRAVEPLVQALKDEYRDVNRSAAEALGTIRDANAVELIIQALGDESEDVRWGAARALGAIGDKRAVEPLVQALKDGDSDVRYEAAAALGTMGEPAVESLIQALNDRDSFVRKKAAKALGTIGDARAVEPLIQALQDRDSVVRKEATTSLNKLSWKPRDDTERVLYLIAWRDWNELARTGELAVTRLIPALEDEDSKVRGGAAEALGKIGDVRAAGPLVRALKDEKARPSRRPTVQKAMNDALEKIDKKKKR